MDTTFFVSDHGNDANGVGTQKRPFKTLQPIIDRLSPELPCIVAWFDDGAKAVLVVGEGYSTELLSPKDIFLSPYSDPIVDDPLIFEGYKDTPGDRAQ